MPNAMHYMQTQQSINSSPRSRTTAANMGAARNVRLPYRVTCSLCRSKKIKCDGLQPTCGYCRRHHVECSYDKPPSMKQVLAMTHRIAELERTLRGDHHRSSSVASSNGGLRTPEPDAVVVDNDKASSNLANISLDKEGNIGFFGATSSVRDDSIQDHQLRDAPVALPDPTPALGFDTPGQAESLAISTAALHLAIPRDIIEDMLRTHWTWVHPMFMFVHKSSFIRDMASGGDHFSVFLLNVICAHSTRFTQPTLRESLINQARLRLGSEICGESSIPKLQGLLQMSALEVGLGRTSQAWLYSGMAFRMSNDLGLHLSAQNIPLLHKRFSREEIHIRRQLFWSCFLWDKAISLYLGRMPMMREAADLTLSDWSLESDADKELWFPYRSTGVVEADPYPETKSRMITCFVSFCKLSVVIGNIVMTLYNNHQKQDIDGSFLKLRESLAFWKLDLPDYLWINVEQMPEACPPPHVLNQNLLYYTTVILLHRPLRKSASRSDICKQASGAIRKLLDLLNNSYGLIRLTYLMAYCVYIAATVSVEELRKDGQVDVVQQTNLDMFLKALHEASKSCPGIQRSIDIINSRVIPRKHTDSDSLLRYPQHDQMPAFPIPEYILRNDDDGSVFKSMPGVDLDAFPQYNADIFGSFETLFETI